MNHRPIIELGVSLGPQDAYDDARALARAWAAFAEMLAQSSPTVCTHPLTSRQHVSGAQWVCKECGRPTGEPTDRQYAV